MPDESQDIIARYWKVRRRLEALDRECQALDTELVEIEKLMPDDFDSGDDVIGGPQGE